jgi:hypothetical protein
VTPCRVNSGIAQPNGQTGAPSRRGHKQEVTGSSPMPPAADERYCSACDSAQKHTQAMAKMIPSAPIRASA